MQIVLKLDVLVGAKPINEEVNDLVFIRNEIDVDVTSNEHVLRQNEDQL